MRQINIIVLLLLSLALLGPASSNGQSTQPPYVCYDGSCVEITSPHIFTGNTLSYTLKTSGPSLNRFRVFKHRVNVATANGLSWFSNGVTPIMLDDPQSVYIPLNFSGTTAYITIAITLEVYEPDGTTYMLNRTIERNVISNNTTFLPGTALTPALTNALVNSYSDTVKMNAPSGGISKKYKYQWQRKKNSTDWEDIPNETAPYLSPRLVDCTRNFRRQAISDTALVLDSNLVATGPEFTICALDNPQITAVNRIIPYNTSGSLNGAAISKLETCLQTAPALTVSYQWQKKNSSDVFTDIGGATAKDLASTGNLTNDGIFRRKYTCGSLTAYSNEVYISLLPQTLQGLVELTKGPNTHVQSVVINTPGINTMTQVYGLTPANSVKTTQYFDGLGRSIQTVTHKGALETSAPSAAKDLVTPEVYDAFGRLPLQYLPYASPGNTGLYKADALNEQKTFYNTLLSDQPGEVSGTANWAYGQTVFENSPLNRVTESFQPGVSWAGTAAQALEANRRSVKQYSRVNTVADSVRLWKVTNSATIGVLGTYATTAIYPAGQLFKSVTADEQSKQIVEFKDQEGRVILKKVQLTAASDAGAGSGHVSWLCTYYIYDDLGNLRSVLPPRAVEILAGNSWNTSDAEFRKQLLFQYAYDNRNRMIIKQIPGADTVEMIYDLRDRLALSRDGKLRTTGNQWQVTLYDDLDRPVMSGFHTTTKTSAQLRADMNSATAGQTIVTNIPAISDLVVNAHDGRRQYIARSTIEFVDGFDTGAGGTMETVIDLNATSTSDTTIFTNTIPGLTAANLEPLSYTYYDSYTYPGKKDVVFANLSMTVIGSPVIDAQPISQQIIGQVTGSKVKMLDGSNQWLTTTTYYDLKGRVRQVLSDNLCGGTDILSTLYSFNNKVLNTYLVHNNPRSTATPQSRVLTMTEYDYRYRPIRISKKLNDSLAVDIATLSYNSLDQLKVKSFKRNNNTVLESLEYDYTINGWLRGINRLYANGGTGHYFGQELHYDQVFSTISPLYDGNIAGIKWRGYNNAAVKYAYGYSYDKAGRLMKGDFIQSPSGANTWAKNSASLFDVRMGDGMNPTTAYDANGNIREMKQYGIKSPGVSGLIDSLFYNYKNSQVSNQLAGVLDKANNPTSTLGDFLEPAPGGNTNDYDYDANGNLTRDANKAISQITYNPLNLPVQITVTGKGTITYAYDAAGIKHRKTVQEQVGASTKTTITDYIAGNIYQGDTLQQIGHEEGRIRAMYATGQPVRYYYDYFVKDHLGNVRMVLTEQTNLSSYAASMEPESAPLETALFSNIDESRANTPSGYPDTLQNTAVARLNGSDANRRIGPSLVLKVMAGDTIRIGARAFYKSESGNHPANKLAPVADMAGALVRAFGNPAAATAADHAASTSSNGTPFTSDFVNDSWQRMKEKEEKSNPNPQRPRAYLNFALFDEQFKLVQDNSGVKQVNQQPDELQALTTDNMVMEQSGYLYVYTSNESPQDVFFDNLIVLASTGPVLEETHYYPFGLVMDGISGKALYRSENRFQFNGKELQNKEFTANGISGLEWYDYKSRMYDPQIGRWFVPDAAAGLMRQYSPYAYAYDNPIRFVDIEGLIPKQATEGDPKDLYKNAARIDMTNAPATSKPNAAGHPRNGPWFWREMLKQHPEMFDAENVTRIRQGLSPEANAKWIEFNPNHAAYKGNKLIHHHIDQGNMAAGIPEKAHQKFHKELHANSGGKKTARVGTKLAGFAVVFDIAAARNGNPHSLWNQIGGISTSDIGKIKYDESEGIYYTVDVITPNKDANGNVISTTYMFTSYADYEWDEKKGRYIGVKPQKTYTQTYDNRTGRGMASEVI